MNSISVSKTYIRNFAFSFSFISFILTIFRKQFFQWKEKLEIHRIKFFRIIFAILYFFFFTSWFLGLIEHCSKKSIFAKRIRHVFGYIVRTSIFLGPLEFFYFLLQFTKHIRDVYIQCKYVYICIYIWIHFIFFLFTSFVLVKSCLSWQVITILKFNFWLLSKSTNVFRKLCSIDNGF